MVKVSTRSLRFVREDLNSIPETGGIDRERGDNDIEIRLGDDSDMQTIGRQTCGVEGQQHVIDNPSPSS